FELGGFEVLTKGRDLLIVTAGYMVHECNKALDALDKAGMDASLVDLYSIPFDGEALLDLANDNGGNILTVEDNYGGGIGSAVADAVTESGDAFTIEADAVTESGDAFTIEQMLVRRIPKSTRDEEGMLKLCELDHDAITRKAAQMLGVVGV
ncbi:MAG: transketolase C-terminal domain-containing protein, partial [Planctomycetota bacterium]